MKFIIKIYLFVSVVLFADEPIGMNLENIIANDSLVFSVKQSYFNCYPYGVIPLEKLLRDKHVSKVCQNEYLIFKKRYPKLYFFAFYHLHVRQNYMVKLQKEGCLIFSKGKKTYSEILLEQGLAIIDPKIKNQEYDFYFFNAQARAKREKKGLWGDPAMQKCKAELLRK